MPFSQWHEIKVLRMGSYYIKSMDKENNVGIFSWQVWLGIATGSNRTHGIGIDVSSIDVGGKKWRKSTGEISCGTASII